MENQFNISVDDIPKKWYNILPDLPEPMPKPMDPEEGPSRLQNLPNLLLGECLKQEFSEDSWIDIPEGVRELYAKAGRPRPLFRATRLEEYLGTPAKLFYKSEFYSPTGSHKVNTALAQAYYAVKEGYENLSTETGAGQWGTALSYACSIAGLKAKVFWVRAVHSWKQDRLAFMHMLGSEVFASPSDQTETGRVRRPRGRRQGPERDLLSGVCAQPCSPPPDRHRSRDDGAAQGGGGRT
jgi:tryptophan synthase beta chain